MSYVLLVNEMKHEFKDKAGGREYIIPPGKAAKVPEHIAYHFIGDPRILNGEDDIAAAAERKRVNLRYAVFNTKEDIKKLPKLRIEPYEEAELQIVEVAKKDVSNEPKEEEFPDIKPKKGVK